MNKPVFILMLDGLEYNLVLKWNLENLKQKTYGKIQLRREYFIEDTKNPFLREESPVPYTPTVWASFLTGLPPEKHGVKDMITYSAFWNKLRMLPMVRRLKGKRRLFWRLGIKPRLINKKDLPSKTFIDAIKPSIAIDVPTYNEPTEYFMRMSQSVSKGIDSFEREALRIFRERKTKTLERINDPWRLFMTYFKIADFWGHLYYVRRPSILRELYNSLDATARDLKMLIPKNTVFLIISDHGMEDSGDGVTGNHSDHAFWSLNLETDWKPKDITDFYAKILKEWL